MILERIKNYIARRKRKKMWNGLEKLYKKHPFEIRKNKYKLE